MNNIQCCLGPRRFLSFNWRVRVAVTALFTFWFDKQMFGFLKLYVAWPALTRDH